MMMSFIIDTLLDIFSTLLKLGITTVLIYLASIVVYYIRRQDKFFNRFIAPKDRVYIYRGDI